MDLCDERVQRSTDRVHQLKQSLIKAISKSREFPKDPSAPEKPLTIEEAAHYTSTRTLPPRFAQDSTRTTHPPDPPNATSTYPGLTLDSSNPTLSRAITLPITPKLRNHILTTSASSLPDPTPPPLLSKAYLQTLPPRAQTRIADQRAYAIVFNNLERDGDWLWWEKQYVDIDAANRDFGPSAHNVGSGSGSGIGGDGDAVMVGTDKDGNVLGEEEEEIPENERLRTDNNKRIAAYVVQMLKMGVVD